MSSIRHLRAADRRRTPWKNGGGTTSEVLLFPEGATADDFDWRISLADVECPGMFSIFPGVDRITAVMEGRLALAIKGEAQSLELIEGGQAMTYPGDFPTFGVPLDGPVRDLNLMLRRGRWIGSIEYLPTALGNVPVSAEQCVILAPVGAQVDYDGEGCDLGAGDAIWLVPATDDFVSLSASTPLYIIQMCREGPEPLERSA